MKRYIIFLLLMMMGVGMLHAQAPQKFSYQAVVRTQTGQLVSSQQVGVRISILRYSATGVSVYGETQTVITNANGLFTMAVGEGTVTTGNLNAINWADGPYYLKSEIDPMGGTNYTITATKQMMSVPYALYALRSDTANFANTALWAQNIIGGFHESQILTMSHDTIFLSGGSFVVLPGNNKDTLYVVNNGYDTVYYHTYDTINRYYRDTVYTHSYDTVYSHSSDTVSHYTRDTVFTHSVDTVFTHSFDTVNRFFSDTIFNRTFDTVFTHSFDTINRIFLDTVYNTIYHNDTVLVHMGSDTLHLYHVTHDTAYVYSFDTVNHYYIDTIFNRTFDTVFTHSFDTVFNRTYDTTFTHVYDTVNRYYRDTIYNRTLDTVFVHSFDTVYNRTYDTTFTHVYDTVIRYYMDTVYNRTFDTVFTHSFDTVFNRTYDTLFAHVYDTVNRYYRDTIYNRTLDTVFTHSFDTVYNRTYDTTFTHVYDTVNRYYMDTVYNRTFDTVFTHSFDTVFNRTYDTTFTHVYDTVNRYYRDTIYNRTLDTVFVRSFDTVYNRTYDTVYTFSASAVDTHYVDSVLLHSGFITSFTESQILSISNDTIYLTGGSFVKLPAGFSGDYNDLSNRPVIPTVPTNVSAFTNDAGYLTTETPQVISINGDTIFLSNGGFAILPAGFSGDYNDLTNKPTIPTSVSELANDAGYITGYTEVQALSMSHDTIFLTGGSFVKIPAGFSGDYNDLTNKPTLPTTVSDLTNDAGYITSADLPAVPTNVSAFTNDAGYLTSYTETQNLADVVANGNSAGHSQIKNVNDPTDPKDAVNKRYLDSVESVLMSLISSGVSNSSCPAGAVNSCFSVSPTKKIRFSKGNLQYQASTQTWRFAEHQYDYVGGNVLGEVSSSIAPRGNVEENGVRCNNNNRSSTYSGWIDLYKFGTSGWNGYQPYGTSGNTCGSLTETNVEADWGIYNAIVNGGNQPGLWRTLTSDEWTYLLSRGSSSYLIAKVNDVDGILLFPDNWTCPNPLLVMTTSGIKTNYSTSEFLELENLGVVFLPITHWYRTSGAGSLYHMGSFGSYWSTSNSSIFRLTHSGFSTYSGYGNMIANIGSTSNNNGGYCAVRLVQDVSDFPLTVTACDSYTWHGTTYNISGDYTYENESLHLTINQSTHNSETQSATGIYTWRGTDYSTTGDYTYDYTNTAGCPSTDTLHLTIGAPSVTITNGALPGIFSVAADRTVKFSQGNLQYTTQGTHAVSGGETATGTWRFAEHQYDYIGADNSNISSTYTGYIDLFCWGTSGWNSGATAYQPWATSTTYGHYYIGGSSSNSLTGACANADWGVYNAISNGGNLPERWRTLTKDEWAYLLDTRTTAASGVTSDARYCKATVGGVQGLIIFPDSYTHPAGHAPALVSVNMPNIAFTVNNIASDEWSYIELAGAVFLPGAGFRNDNSVGDVGVYGSYWSSSHYGTSSAYYLYFNNGVVYPSNGSQRYLGRSVRLVQDNMIETSHAACDSYIWHGTTYNTSGDYTYENELLHLTINQSTHNSETQTATGSYTWHGTDYSTSGNYTYDYTNTAGCPSTDTLHLTISVPPPSVTITNGALPGDFSVAADRTVKFSQGNLQYTTQGTHAVSGGETATGTWRFAEHQYDYIGATNSSASSSYDGYIDLFGWGTSRYHESADSYNTRYAPWSTVGGTVNSTYNNYGYGPSTNRPSPNLTGTSANYDWGVYNAISNGGNLPGQWRTLTKDEWVYLLDTRTTTVSGVTSNARYCKATVGGVQGLIIFPDSYTHPTDHVPTLVSVNTTTAAYTVNDLALGEWAYMEQAGAVFLPAAGGRSGTTVNGIGSSGYYWSSSYYSSRLANILYFSSDSMGPSSSGSRHGGCAVRLVKDNN